MGSVGSAGSVGSSGSSGSVGSVGSASGGLTVATPWYPVPYNRMAGAFVAEHARLASRIVPQVRVVHGLEWPGGTDAAAQTLRPAFDAVLDHTRYAVGGSVGPVDRVPVFTVGGASWADRAQALVRDVRRAVGGFDTALVHGHVGYLGGVLAARLADPAARVFATEHSTALREVLSDPAACDLYAELLDRAQAVWCVSGLLREQVLERVADPHGRVQVLPNPVDFTGVPQRAQLPQRLSRWLFIGGLHERKGVHRLVQAFCIAARQDPALTLTMVGDGPLAASLREIAVHAGVGDRLHLPGVLPHAEVVAQLPQYDVLFAPSTYETFHLAVVEAVAAGVPVVVTRSGGPQEALAGVEDQVGRFVDVHESPDALVEAWQDLSANLGGLDLPGARARLDARYGIAAITAQLARAYGVDGSSPGSRATPTPASQDQPGTVAPERIVLLATSGWRRYSVEAELAAARQAAVPTVVVTTDPQITAWSQGLAVLAPKAVDLAGAPRPVAPALPLTTRARRLLGRVVRGVARGLGRGPARRPGAGRPEETTAGGRTPVRVDAAFWAGATLVVTDCQSMPLARSMLAAYPGLQVVTELTRPDPVDGA